MSGDSSPSETIVVFAPRPSRRAARTSVERLPLSTIMIFGTCAPLPSNWFPFLSGDRSSGQRSLRSIERDHPGRDQTGGARHLEHPCAAVPAHVDRAAWLAYPAAA